MTNKYKITEEEEQALFDRFPTMFPNGKNVDPRESLMCFGIECNRGWYNIIWKLCEEIEKVEKGLPDGYRVIVSQVKEKFSGLRFYTSGCTDKVYELINKAEKESYVTCEYCGKPGENRENIGWVYTLCDEHFNEKILERFGTLEAYEKWKANKEPKTI